MPGFIGNDGEVKVKVYRSPVADDASTWVVSFLADGIPNKSIGCGLIDVAIREHDVFEGKHHFIFAAHSDDDRMARGPRHKGFYIQKRREGIPDYNREGRIGPCILKAYEVVEGFCWLDKMR